MADENQQEIVATVINNPDLLEEVIRSQEAKTVIYQQSEMSIHTGPLPRPEDVVKYSGTIPNFGERIMAYAEKEQDARHRIADKTLQLNRIGLYFGLLSVCLLLIFAALLLYAGHAGLATTVVTGALVSVVGIFVIGKRHQDKNQQE